MSNFTSANPSIDAMLAAAGQYGMMTRFFGGSVPATTATAGLVLPSVMRFPAPLIIPSVTSGLQGYCLTGASAIGNNTGINFTVALEYLLGTITLSGNVASNLGSMPTKTQLGTSLQTASKYLILYTNTTGTATTPTITVTYTNQDGTLSQSTSIQTATSPIVGTAYTIPLAAGDSGVRAVTGISSSVTTGALVFNIYGILQLATSSIVALLDPNTSVEPLLSPTLPKYLCAPGDAVNLYQFGSAGVAGFFASLAFAPETT